MNREQREKYGLLMHTKGLRDSSNAFSEGAEMFSGTDTFEIIEPKTGRRYTSTKCPQDYSETDHLAIYIEDVVRDGYEILRSHIDHEEKNITIAYRRGE